MSTIHQALVLLPLIRGTKRPMLVRWSDPGLDPDTVSKIFAENPGCNVGLRLDQFVVVDCDTPAMVDWWSTNGPMTVFQSQGNPEHRSFWYLIDPDDEARPSRRPGIDVKTGPGHQCVVPPSTHPSGKKYCWLGSAVTEERRPRPLSGTTLSALLDRLSPERAPVGDGAGWDVVMEGEGRDNFLAAAAGFLRARGASVAAVREGLRYWNQAFCEPRLTSGDLDRIARSSGRWGPDLTFEDEDGDQYVAPRRRRR